MIEIAVQDVAGARIAYELGADRVELCSALEVGGLTPSTGVIEESVDVGIPVQVLIRPRPGDFVYNDAERAVVERDVRRAIGAGAAGVVVGALTNDSGALDVDAIRSWARAARAENPHADVTIHRCVDVLLGAGVSTRQLAEQIHSLGGRRDTEAYGARIDRVLTSGGADTARQGAHVLMKLQSELSGLAKAESDLVVVMAAGGVLPDDVAELHKFGIYDVHLSARTQIPPGPAGPGGGASTRDVTDPEIVAAAIAAARA